MAWLDDAIAQVAQQTGLDPNLLRRTVQIESSGNPNASTGSYHGLMQLSNGEFNRYGGGNIFNPLDNLKAGATKMMTEMRGFADKYGRDPTPTDYYLNHQQGTGGLAMHLQHPDQAAWKSMYMTGEGQQKGEDWARRAIWGNVPDSDKRRFGNVDNLTSRDFYNLWQNRVEGSGAGGMPTGTAALPSEQSFSAEDAPGLLSGTLAGVQSKAQGQVPGVTYTPTPDPVSPGMLARAPQTGGNSVATQGGGIFGTGTGMLGTGTGDQGGGTDAALLQAFAASQPQEPTPPPPLTPLPPMQLGPRMQLTPPQVSLSQSPLSMMIARAAAQRGGGM
jgi:hypothetical protein